MSQFVFTPDSNNPSAQYEYVNFLPSVPRNVKDLHDMENILRFRVLSVVKELFGNMRVTENLGDVFSVVTDGGKSYFKINGVWYIHGYRVFVDDILSNEVNTSTAYKIWLALKFREVDYTEDSSIALQDAGTNNFIATSTRIAFNIEVIAQDNTEQTNPTVGEGVYLFHVANAEYNTDEWLYEDSNDFVYINLKYAEAISIVNRAVHTELDQRTVEVQKLTTNATANQPRFEIEEVSSDKIRVAFLDGNDVVHAAFEMIKQGGEWQPILWMRPSATENILSYLTAEGLSVADSHGNSSKMTNKLIKLGNYINGFLVDNNELAYFVNGKKALRARRVAPFLANQSVNLTLDNSSESTNINDPLYGAAAVIEVGYDQDKVKTTDKKAIYTTTIPRSILPKDYILNIRHKIITTAVSGVFNGGVITAKVEVAFDAGSYTAIQHTKFLLTQSIQVVDEIFPVSVASTASVPSFTNLNLKITYSLEPFAGNVANSSLQAKVGLKTSEHVTWEYYTETYSLVEMECVTINGHHLWIDDDGVARIKKTTNNPGNDLDDLFSTSQPGEFVTDEGGKAIGSGTSFDDVTLETDANGTYTEPTYVSGSKTLFFPVVNDTMENDEAVGLVSVGLLKTLTQSKEAPERKPLTATPKNVVYVAKEWDNLPENGRYMNKIQDAVNYVINNYSDGTIVVYPGVYTENINLGAIATVNGNKISIVALDPLTTKIKGKIYNDGKYINAFINIPIEANDSLAVDITSTAPTTMSKFYFGANARIESSLNLGLINIARGHAEFKGEIVHLGSSSAVPTISVGSGAEDSTKAVAYFYEKISGENPVGSIYIVNGNVFVYDTVTNTSNTTNTNTGYMIRIESTETAQFVSHKLLYTSSGMGVIRANTTSTIKIYGDIKIDTHSTAGLAAIYTGATGVHVELHGDINVQTLSAPINYVIYNSGTIYIKNSTLHAGSNGAGAMVYMANNVGWIQCFGANLLNYKQLGGYSFETIQNNNTHIMCYHTYGSKPNSANVHISPKDGLGNLLSGTYFETA